MEFGRKLYRCELMALHTQDTSGQVKVVSDTLSTANNKVCPIFSSMLLTEVQQKFMDEAKHLKKEKEAKASKVPELSKS
jgi:hypothetical protein